MVEMTVSMRDAVAEQRRERQSDHHRDDLENDQADEDQRCDGEGIEARRGERAHELRVPLVLGEPLLDFLLALQAGQFLDLRRAGGRPAGDAGDTLDGADRTGEAIVIADRGARARRAILCALALLQVGEAGNGVGPGRVDRLKRLAGFLDLLDGFGQRRLQCGALRLEVDLQADDRLDEIFAAAGETGLDLAGEVLDLVVDLGDLRLQPMLLGAGLAGPCPGVFRDRVDLADRLLDRGDGVGALERVDGAVGDAGDDTPNTRQNSFSGHGGLLRFDGGGDADEDEGLVIAQQQPGFGVIGPAGGVAGDRIGNEPAAGDGRETEMCRALDGVEAPVQRQVGDRRAALPAGVIAQTERHQPRRQARAFADGGVGLVMQGDDVGAGAACASELVENPHHRGVVRKRRSDRLPIVGGRREQVAHGGLEARHDENYKVLPLYFKDFWAATLGHIGQRLGGSMGSGTGSLEPPARPGPGAPHQGAFDQPPGRSRRVVVAGRDPVQRVRKCQAAAPARVREFRDARRDVGRCARISLKVREAVKRAQHC